jgi:hypothetical protein
MMKVNLKDLSDEQAHALLLASGVAGVLFIGTRTLMDAMGKATSEGGGHTAPSVTGNPMVDSAIYFNPANPLGWSNRNLLPALFWANRNVPGVKNIQDVLGVGNVRI